MSKFSDTLQTMAPSGVGLRIKNALDEESWNDFLKAISDSSVPLPRIRKTLEQMEISVSKGTLERWRKGIVPRDVR